MPAVEILAVLLGPAIAKALIRHLTDEDWLFEFSKDLIDSSRRFLGSSTGARQASQRIDEIGDQVAGNLAPFFKSEGTFLNKQELGVVSLEVASTLSKSRISSRLVTDCRLDPDKLYHHIRDTRPDADRDLSADESSFYQRILVETALQIIKVSPELEGFESEFSTLLLQDHQQLLSSSQYNTDLLEKMYSIIKEQTRHTRPISPHQLNSPPDDFVGRKPELKSLLSSIEKGCRIIGLFGMPGVGKTTLALKLAQELSPGFPDAQLFVDLKGTDRQSPLTPADAMAFIIRSLLMDPEIKLTINEAKLKSLYCSVLHDKGVLLFLDNARDVAQVEPLVPPSNCFMIVTSRRRFHLPGMKDKDVGEFSPRISRQFLTKIEPRIRSSAGEIAKLCGYLPLALRVAASALKVKQDLTPAEYTRRLQDVSQRLQLTGVQPAFKVSYNLLTMDMQDYYCQLSVFPAEFDKDAVAYILGIDPDKAWDILGELFSYSLLKYNHRSSGYDLHDLVRFFAADILLKNHQYAYKVLERHADYYLSFGSKINDLYLSGGDNVYLSLSLFHSIWPHLQTAWFRLSSRDKIWPVPDTAEHVEAANQWLLAFPENVAYLLDLFLPPHEKIIFLETALDIACKIGDRSSEGNHRGNLGLAYRNLGQVERAIEYHEQALVISKEIGDRHGEGNHLGNLGNAHLALGQVEQAIEYYQQALQIAQEIGDRRGEASQVGNLGNAYFSLGQVERAIEYYQQALQIAQGIGNRRGEGTHLGNLGNAYLVLGQVEQAIEYHEQALVISKEIGDRRGEASQVGNLGNAYTALGQVERAIEYQEQALVISKEIGDRLGEGNHLGNLGIAYLALGQVEQAIDYHEQALVIAQEIGDRRGEASQVGNLGNTYFSLGQVERAIEYHEQALVFSKEISDRRGEGNHLGNLGNAYFFLGQVERAIEYHEQALVIAQEIGDRRGEGNHLGNLGLAYAALGQVKRAVEYCEQALAITREIGDRRGEGNHLRNLGNAYLDLGQVEQAIDYFEQALVISKEIGDRRGEAFSSWNMGLILEKTGDLPKAIEHMQLRVDYERSIGHTDYEQNAAHVDSLRKKLKR